MKTLRDKNTVLSSATTELSEHATPMFALGMRYGISGHVVETRSDYPQKRTPPKPESPTANYTI